jgi:predicted Zn-dependent protease
LFFWLLIPLLAGQIARAIPVGVEARLGEQVVQQFRSMGPKGRIDCVAPAGREVLDRLVRRLAIADERRLPLVVEVVNAPIVNAFALPGGRIVIFRGLLDFMVHPNELAGVLAHEMAHSDLRHPTEVAVQRGAAGFAIGVLLGDVVGLSVVAILGQSMLEAAYSREAELAADARGLETLRRARLDSRPIGDFFARLQVREGETPGLASLLSTHPASDSRAARARQANPAGERALSQSEWLALKAICR